MRPVLALTATALLAACASSHPIEPRLAPASVNFTSAAQQRVELENFDFNPHEIHLRAGRPYTLELANTGSGGHDFAAPEFFAAAQVRPTTRRWSRKARSTSPAGRPNASISFRPRANTTWCAPTPATRCSA